jgi:hypothetical protein
MKKIIFGLMLCLISSFTFACHFDHGGICGNKVYLHGFFSPNSIFQFRLYGDSMVLLTFTTGNDTTEIDSTITIPIANGQTDVKVQFHNHYLSDSSYNNWAGNYDVTGYYEVIDSTNSACGILPVSFSNLMVQRKDNSNISVIFTAGDETGIKGYNIYGTADQKVTTQSKWVLLKSITASGQNTYIVLINITGAFTMFLFAAIFFMEKAKTGKKRWIQFLLFGVMIFVISCKRDIVSPKVDHYKFIKVESVGANSVSVHQEISPI